MGRNRDCVVCPSCGDASWQYAYRAWKNPQCKYCGSSWSEWTTKGYRLSDYTGVDNSYRLSDYTGADNNTWHQWPQWGKKNRSPKAHAVLTEVWEFLPQKAKDMIGDAGWNPPEPTAPPGLEGWSSSPDRMGESQELVQSLWNSVEEDQRKVLEKLGLVPKPQPKTSLRELCKLHAPDLPKEIQDLLEEPPAPKPTVRQAVAAANKQFKEATFKLREAIIQKSDLQSKVDKVKDQYMGLLRQLQEANDSILRAQQQVQVKQTTLQEAVRDDLVEIEDETAEALKKAGLVATKEQAKALTRALQEKGRTQAMDVDSIELEAADMDVSAIQSLKRKIDDICERKEHEAKKAASSTPPETQNKKEENQGDRRSRSPKKTASKK